MSEFPYICPICKTEIKLRRVMIKMLKGEKNEWRVYAAHLVNHLRREHYVITEDVKKIKNAGHRTTKINNMCKIEIVEIIPKIFPKAFALQLMQGMLGLDDNSKKANDAITESIEKLTSGMGE